MNKNQFRKTLAAVIGIVMVLSATVCAYAFEGGSYHDFRDGEVTFYLPDGWSSEEVDAGESEDQIYEKIMAARDDSGASALELNVYYMSDEALQDDYVYFDGDEEGAREYYENYGRETVDELYDAVLAWPLENASQSEWQISEPEFFDGEWNGFLVINGSGSTQAVAGGEGTSFEHTVYLTAEMTDDSEIVVHNMLVFSNESGSALDDEERKLAEEIADEFYDYNYANVMTGTTTDDSLWVDDYGTDSESGMDEALTIIIGVLATLVPFLIIVATIVLIVKRVMKKRKARVRTTAGQAFNGVTKELKEAQQSFDLDDTITRWKKRRAEKDSFSSREKRTERRTERREERRIERRSTLQMRNREAETAEQRYYASLQTLHKTGLLTKAEMRDMLERHERSRSRQRSR